VDDQHFHGGNALSCGIRAKGGQDVGGICGALAFTTKQYSLFLIASNLPDYLPDYFLDILCKNDNIKDCHKRLTKMEKR